MPGPEGVCPTGGEASVRGDEPGAVEGKAAEKEREL